MGRFFKIFPNLSQNWADWYMNGSLFLEKLVFVWVYFQISWWHVPTKTKLEYPPGVDVSTKYAQSLPPSLPPSLGGGKRINSIIHVHRIKDKGMG